jgi:hypothetical protein
VTDLMLPGTVPARHNWNRWVADCRVCTSALTIPPGTAEVTCWDCGATIGPILWPPDPDGIEAILAYRPDPNTRSWEPGETLAELLAENAAHGLLPDAWLALDDPHGRLELMSTVGEVIVGGLLLDALPAGRPRPAIGS